MELPKKLVERFMRRTPGSMKAQKEASQWIPGGVNRGILSCQPYPLCFVKGDGQVLTDVDGNEYLDFNGNYSALVFGHCHQHIKEAMARQLHRGTAWAGASEGERKLARALAERIPSIDQIKFTASGTEATLCALRAARSFTRRRMVARFAGGYHGFHDYVAVDGGDGGDDVTRTALQKQGIPDSVFSTMVSLPFNDQRVVEKTVQRYAGQLAAIIVEPVLGVGGVIPPKGDFLEMLRSLTRRLGIVLIFDEVITFRIDTGGAQSRYGVSPDITTLGKVIGGGLPIGAVGGSKAIMQRFGPAEAGGEVTLSGTFHANPLTLAAGAAGLELLSLETIKRINELTTRLASNVNELFRSFHSPLRMQSVGSLFNLHFAEEPVYTFKMPDLQSKHYMHCLYTALLCEGILLSPRGFGCVSIPMTVADVTTFCGGLTDALKFLKEP